MIVLAVALYFVAYMFFIAMQQILVAFQYFNIMSKKEGMGLLDRIDAINKDGEAEKTGDDVNIFEIKKDTTEQTPDKNEITEDKAETKDDTNRFSDDAEENRFKDKDDNDRFKPKY